MQEGRTKVLDEEARREENSIKLKKEQQNAKVDQLINQEFIQKFRERSDRLYTTTN